MRRSKAPGFIVNKTGPSQAAPIVPAVTSNDNNVGRNKESILALLGSASHTATPAPNAESANPATVLDESPQANPVNHSGLAFAIVFCKASSRKHKVWEGDGVLFIQEKTAVAKTSEGNTLGTISLSKCQDIADGTKLFIGGKEIQVLEPLTPQEAAERITPAVSNKRLALQDKSNSNEPAPHSYDSEPSSCQEPHISSIFAIVFAKPSTRKHKVWEGNGYLHVNNRTASAKDENGKSIGSTKLPNDKVLEPGTRLMLGGKEMEIVEEISAEELHKRNSESASHTSAPPAPKPYKINNLLSRHFISPALNKQVSAASCPGLVLPDPSDEEVWQEGGAGLTPVVVDPFLTQKLRPHQRRGLIFLYECIMGFKDKNVCGAILADEMGLGKTLQCIALVWTLLKQGPYGKPVANNILIVTPSSLTGNWAAEFAKWLDNSRLVPYVIDGKNKPERRAPHQHVVIVSYEMLIRHRESIGDQFDLLICDEAHRLKNADTKVSQTLNELCVNMRILLTGTPIQNDLQEFYSLVDFSNPNYLGTYAQFRRKYEDPILAARQPDASEEVREAGEEIASELSQQTSVFILRRTQSVLDSYLPGKTEVVVMCRASEAQQSVYNAVLSQLDVSSLMGFDSAGHLPIIAALRKIANHPALLVRDSNAEEHHKVDTGLYNKDDAGPEDSGKLMVVMRLLEEMWTLDVKHRERIVLVSSFTRTLDMLQEVCRMLSYPTLRLDGSTPSNQRTDIVSRFNNDSSQFVFLLSAKAGGVGLNLIGASRLVLFDSDWNPATDLQAMARIWRDGQQRQVFIYRLLTSGTIDEKIFQRQLSKQTLAGGIIDSASSNSVLLSRDQLKEIFQPCEVLDGCWTHDSLGCPCNGDGAVPALVTEKEPSRDCQMGVQSSGSTLRLEELMSWHHEHAPFSSDTLSLLNLSLAESHITFIFSTSCG